MIGSQENPRAPGISFGREIGHGSHGVVFEAEDARGRRIAVKVLKTRDPAREKAFLVECALVQRVKDAAVVPVHDVFRTEDGRLACTMELVSGRTLLELARAGDVPSTRALAVAASTARALSSIHGAGIIHRDVKPANIFVEPGGRVRVLDFGIATDAKVKTPPGAIAGTPSYLSPEQALGLPTSPATDIWALGVILYELLTGAVPFDSPTLGRLLQGIVGRPPVAPRSLNPALGAATEAIVLRCLEKDPAGRFESAEALGWALEQLLGDSSVEEALAPVIVRRLGAIPAPEALESEIAPEPLPQKERATARHRWSWDFEVPPAKLWETVSDTEKFNRAIGLPPVELRDVPDGKGGIERIGSVGWLGLDVEWIEHPFEWVAPERLSVLRVYRKGPLEALWSEMTLVPRADGGTTLVHELHLAPRGTVGRIAASLEVWLRARKKIEAVYRRLAESARRKEPLELETGTTPLAQGGEERIARATARLAAVSTSFARLAPRLAALVRGAPDPDATRIRPFELADRWGSPRLEVVRLLARGAAEGMLELSWHLLCPVCRVPARALPTLATLKARAHCEACGAGWDVDFAHTVEAVFRPRPEVRPIPFETYCKGGPGFFPHVLLQQELEPGETRSVTVKLEPGPWRIACRGLRGGYEFQAEEGARDAAATIALERGTVRPGPAVLASGLVGFAFVNASSRRRVVRIESSAWREDALTALAACAIPEIRKLGAATPPGEPIKIASATWLAAHGISRERFADIVEASGGAPTASPALVAGFERTSTALATALALAREGARCALQLGPAAAAALGDGTAFDGPAPRLALEVLEGCQAGEVAATHLVLGAPGVAELVGTRETRTQLLEAGEEALVSVVYMPGSA